jgi:hypothetical protein
MSTARKHTPGPWRWVDMMHHGYVILDSNNDIIATDIYACEPVDMELICAAPEMLAALEPIDDMLGNLSYAYRVDMRTLARTAIAKAKGGTP